MNAPKCKKKVNGDEHTLSKRDLSYDLLALEEFLNEMLEAGWRPLYTKWGTSFTFVPCAPGEYICRVAITITKNGFFDKNRAAELSSLLEADGALVVDQRNTMSSQIGLIAIRPASLGEFEINSDIDSRIAEYTARKKYNETTGVCFLVIGLAYLPLFMTLDNYAFIALFACFFAIAFVYLLPVKKYKEIIANLKAERDISEG